MEGSLVKQWNLSGKVKEKGSKKRRFEQFSCMVSEKWPIAQCVCGGDLTGSPRHFIRKRHPPPTSLAATQYW